MATETDPEEVDPNELPDGSQAFRARLAQCERELAAAQAQLIQQEKLASLGELTAGIAHEIKNPLNFVNNFATLNEELAEEAINALKSGDVEEVGSILNDIRRNSEAINQHGKRAESIVRGMVQHASGGAGTREPSDVNALVDEHVDLAYHGKRAQTSDFNVTLDRDYDANAGSVELIRQEIGRVILNLMGNAFDAVYTFAESAGSDYEPRVHVSTHRVEGWVEIRVADNGPGIPEEITERIFEPFFTTKPAGSGTGLGLALSYDIVTQGHGGLLTVESGPDGGTTFVVAIPSAD